MLTLINNSDNINLLKIKGGKISHEHGKSPRAL